MTKAKCLTGFHLKVIAIVSMLIDHFSYITLMSIVGHSTAVKKGTAVYSGFKQTLLLWAAEHEAALWNLAEVMRWIGRLAFPLFCFLLVEGFLHTRSRWKYALRLGLFALISEIPFDMAFSGCLLSLKNSNVFFTLLVGFLMMWCIEEIKKRTTNGKKWLFGVGAALCAVTACELAEMVFDSPYGASGVLTILALYLLRRNPAFAMCVGVLLLAVLNFAYVQLFAFPAVLLAAMYNGQKGPGIKYFFYGFYPVHLLACTALAVWLGNLHIYIG